MNTDITLQTDRAGYGKKNHVRQTTDRGLFEEAAKQQVMPIYTDYMLM